jgi:hypothetical protein
MREQSAREILHILIRAWTYSDDQPESQQSR